MRQRLTLARTTAVALVAGLALAVGGSRDLVQVAVSETERAMAGPSVEGSAQAPLVGALGLVFLATWGALLLTRGVVRRVLGGLAAVVGTGVVAATAHAVVTLPERARAPYLELGIGTPDYADTRWLALVVFGAVMALVTGIVALVRVGDWPTMGNKYDAPAAAPAHSGDPADLWKSIDEGRDPTIGPQPLD